MEGTLKLFQDLLKLEEGNLCIFDLYPAKSYYLCLYLVVYLMHLMVLYVVLCLLLAFSSQCQPSCIIQ